MQNRTIEDFSVWPIGLGGAEWSINDDFDEDDAIRTIHTALDAGVQLIDTARVYSTEKMPGHNEWLIARALANRSDRDEVLVVTKGGHYRAPGRRFLFDGRPETLRRDIDASLSNLGIDQISLYLLHKPDPAVPIEDSMGAIAEQQSAGKIRYVGVSNVDVPLLRRAQATVKISAVENRLSPLDDSSRDVLDAAPDLPFLAYSPIRATAPWSTLADALPALGRIAAGHEVSQQQVGLAWVLAQSPRVIPVVGARRESSILDSVQAPGLELTGDELAEIDHDIAAIRTEGIRTE